MFIRVHLWLMLFPFLLRMENGKLLSDSLTPMNEIIARAVGMLRAAAQQWMSATVWRTVWSIPLPIVIVIAVIFFILFAIFG